MERDDGTTNNVPNLDCMSPGELMEFWKRYHRPSRADARDLVGDTRPGYTNIASTLAAYACAKACAMDLRLEGDIRGATVYETHCEIYYQDLPDDLKW